MMKNSELIQQQKVLDEQTNQLREYLKDKGFTEDNICYDQYTYTVFTCKNIKVYYRAQYGEWRIKDLSKGICNGMDETSIQFPFDDLQKKICWSVFSQIYKD